MAEQVFSIVGALEDALETVSDAQLRAGALGPMSLTARLQQLRSRLADEARRLTAMDPDAAQLGDVAGAVDLHLSRMKAALQAGDLGGVASHGLALVGSLPGDPQTDPYDEAPIGEAIAEPGGAEEEDASESSLPGDPLTDP